MIPKARYFWLLASAAWPCACAGSNVPRGAVASEGAVASGAAAAGGAVASKPPKPPVSLTASPAKPLPFDGESPRLFPPLDGATTTLAGEARDGSQRLVAYGLRVLARPGGALELAGEYLPAARTVQSLELPTRLGGGFLFSVLTSSATLFFRAQTFTGDLTPFARLDFEAAQVTAGFDRLYVAARRPDRLVALDMEHGAAVGIGSLPPSPAYDKLAFVDAWFGAVEVPFRGTLVTFDAGASWHPLGFAATSIEAREGTLRLIGVEGVLDLDAKGTFTRQDPPAIVGAPENAVARALRAQGGARDESRKLGERLGRQALKQAVLRGFRDADGSLVTANAGMLLRVRASDGKLLESDEHAYSGGGECTALPLGRGFGFACNDSAGQTTALYSFVSPFGMQRVRSFSGARYVSSSGNGALVVRGSCGELGAVPGAYCIVSNTTDLREIHVRGDLGVERVVALSDGRVAVIVPPRLGAPGFLSLIDAQGRELRRALKLPGPAPATPLLENGLWLDGFVEQPNGLSGWVVGGEPFAGVRVALDGTVAVGRPESSIDHALLSATRALLVGRTGRARESVDGGFSWVDVDLPSEFDAVRELKDDARLQGCSELGCAFGGFVRVGWRSGSNAPRLRIAAVPEPTPLLQPGGSRWLLRCEATGEVSEPARPLGTRVRGPGRMDDAATPLWAPFLELAPPALGPGEVGFDASGNDGDSAQFRAYVWGERGADWARTGHAELRAFDRFQIHQGVFESAATRSPWPDANTAAEAFGFDGTGNPTSWRAVLEPGRRSGALLASSRGLLDLLLFEEGRAVTHIPNASRLGFNFGALSSVAKLGDAWYAASFNENHSLTVSKITAGHVERFAEYPDPAGDAASVSLVRSVRGDELGLWVSGRGWYLYPIDAVSHAAHSPLYQSSADLAQMPAPCAAGADGFLLTGSPSLEPNLRFSRSAEEFSAHRVEAQFVWSARGVCTRALAADTETSIKPSAATTAAFATLTGAVPLTLTERRPQGRRWGYSCAP